MAKNYQQQGLTVEVINTGTTAILSGDLVMVGALACVAATNIEPGETGMVLQRVSFTKEKGRRCINRRSSGDR